MQTFQQFITEGRDYPVYHGLRQVVNIYNILVDGKLLPHTMHRADKLLKHQKNGAYVHGISTTRNFNFAKKWSHEAHDYGPFKKESGAWIVIELDHTALAKRFEILPINFWSSRKHEFEYEEFIIVPKSIDLHRYMKALHVGGDWDNITANVNAVHFSRSLQHQLSLLQNVIKSWEPRVVYH